MKVILRENLANLGEMGETVNVADGYARNFLIPRKLAVQSDSASGKQIDHEMRNIRRREEKVRAELGGVAKQLEALILEIEARSGEEGKIFGSVTSLHIAQKLAEAGFTVDRKNVLLKDPIKTLGTHEVPVKLVRGIEATIKVVVSSMNEPGEAEEEAAAAPKAKSAPAADETAATEASATEAPAAEAAAVEAAVIEAPESDSAAEE